MPDLSNSEISVEGEYTYCDICGMLFHWEQLTITASGAYYCDDDVHEGMGGVDLANERTVVDERAISNDTIDKADMSRLDEKADRLVRAGAVRIISRVIEAGPLPYIIAWVNGDTATYTVELGATGDNTCTCKAYTEGHRRCSHIRALLLYDEVGDLWAAQERGRRRSEQRLEADGLPLADTKHEQRERFR